MSDERLRELERRFAADGTLESKAALLAARARAGWTWGLAGFNVDSGLRLASLLGDPAARIVLGWNMWKAVDYVPDVCTLTEDGDVFPVSALAAVVDDRWGSEVCSRVTVACAWPAVEKWEDLHHCGQRYIGLSCDCEGCSPRNALTAARRWCLDPKNRELGILWREAFTRVQPPAAQAFLPCSPEGENRSCAVAAQEYVGTQLPLRQAILSWVVPWCLGEERLDT